MKQLLILFLIFVSIFQSQSQTAVITESGGWLETAYIKWEPVAEAQSYNVYYTGGGFTDKKIDTQLIRSYGTYFRADVLGLAAGNYTLKVVPVISGVEGASSVTSSLTVLPHDRTGFAFANGRIPGGYNINGTPKTDAVILYITENTKNTVSMTVTGANSNPCIGLQNILDGFKKGKDLRTLIIRLVGHVTDMSYLLNGDVVIENKNTPSSYITFEGVGSDAVADGWGLRIKNASNVEVRNIGFMNCDSGEGDNLGLQQDNDYIWVHNCDMFYGNAGSDADQIKGDGALDCKRSTYVTFSYNHFWDSGKSNLLGLSEGTTSGLYITFHHNWYDHSDSRHPRVRYYSAHVYNNYYDGNAKYGIGSTEGSSVFAENNYFRNCKYPMLTSMQGTDVYGGSGGTFSSEDGGTIKSYNNTMSGQARYVSYHSTNYPVEFDAVEAISREEIISSSIKSKQGGNTYNNFDTDASLYVKNMVPEPPETAKENVILYSGRVNGGDLRWTFNNAVDDASYAVNTGLKSALTNYNTKMVFVQGENPPPASSQTLTLTSSANNEQTVLLGVAISDIVYTWGGDATDVTIVGVPDAGLNYTKNAAAKTITISGTPTADITYTVTTSGVNGTPVSTSGSITVSEEGGATGNMVHNFTESGKTSSFYTITGNLSSSYGTVIYNGLTLTQCLKMESSTNVSFVSTQSGTLTLVFNSDYTGSLKIDGTTYTPSSGMITVQLTAGTHTIIKGSGSNYLFYMSLVYDDTSANGNVDAGKTVFYPNPVSRYLYTPQGVELENISIYTLSGTLIKQLSGNVRRIEMNELNSGNYLLQAKTRQGTIRQAIIKK